MLVQIGGWAQINYQRVSVRVKIGVCVRAVCVFLPMLMTDWGPWVTSDVISVIVALGRKQSGAGSSCGERKKTILGRAEAAHSRDPRGTAAGVAANMHRVGAGGGAVQSGVRHGSIPQEPHTGARIGSCARTRLNCLNVVDMLCHVFFVPSCFQRLRALEDEERGRVQHTVRYWRDATDKVWRYMVDG